MVGTEWIAQAIKMGGTAGTPSRPMIGRGDFY